MPKGGDTLTKQANANLTDDENAKKIKSEKKTLKLQEDEYQLEMSLYNNNYIEFKVTLNSPMATCYYLEKYNYETIKEISSLSNKKYGDLEGVYQYYERKVFKKEMNLVLSPDKNIMSLKYQKYVDDEMTDVELKLKKIMSAKDDIVQALMKEVEQLKQNDKKIDELKKKIDELQKNNDLLMEEINKLKEKGIKEEDIKKEEEIRKKEEEFSSLNDNVNLTNDFKFENFQEIKYIDEISGPTCEIKTVAVYCIIKNNERLYQMAYCKDKYRNNSDTGHIIIYNLILNKIENKIYKAHKDGQIDKLKHYFNSSTKNHILLSSSNDYYVNVILWNISSNPIIKILTIENCLKPCLTFKNEDYFIFGVNYDRNNTDRRMAVWNKNGTLIKKINKSNFNQGLIFIEATYFENKNYILLSGCCYNQNKYSNFSECYNYDEDDIKTYEDNENDSQGICSMNLFKKGNDIYLIAGSKEKVSIFEFYTTQLKRRIQLGANLVNSLCSINEKYVIASNSSKLKIIDMDKFSVVKEYSAHYDDINGIEKIKIPEKGEFIITYSKHCIRIWKI